MNGSYYRQRHDRDARPKSWRDVLPVHPAAELFPLMSEAELQELGEDIKKSNTLRVPVVIWRSSDGDVLLDGRNRLDALEAITGGSPLARDEKGKGRVRWTSCSFRKFAEVTGDIDPVAYVISANIHRRHLTAEQKRDVISKLLKATPEKSNRAIAEVVKDDHKKVGRIRAQLEATGAVPQLQKTVGKDGKARKPPAKKGKKISTPETDNDEKQEPDLPDQATLRARYQRALLSDCLAATEDMSKKTRQKLFVQFKEKYGYPESASAEAMKAKHAALEREEKPLEAENPIVKTWDAATASQRHDFVLARKVEIMRVQQRIGAGAHNKVVVEEPAANPAPVLGDDPGPRPELL
jgi:hypothetical protein